MLGEIVGLQQIMITLAFLGIMIGVLFLLRRKGSAIRSSLHGGRRITIIEDTAVAQGERLRLVQIDDQTFVMVSAKGVTPSLVPLYQSQPATVAPAFSNAFAKAVADAKDSDSSDTSLPMELTEMADVGQNSVSQQTVAPNTTISQASVDDKQMSDFAVTFKRWRQQR
jgi:flagellar biogenesis protein FliO